MRLLSDRIQEFIDWLVIETDFGEWDKSVQEKVHKQLIECMISDPIQEPTSEGNEKILQEKIAREL